MTMVLVAVALVAYICWCSLILLTKLVKEEVHMLLGVPSEMDMMKTKLMYLKRFLVDADRRNITDDSMGEWVKESKEVMYDATDILELCQLKAMENGQSRDMGYFSSLLIGITNPLHAHKIGSRLKTINKKIDDLCRHCTNFHFVNLTSFEDHETNKVSSHHSGRETTAEPDILGLVGEKIKEDTTNLVELLMREETPRSEQETPRSEHNNILVFAIVGSIGIGKTTLAQSIVNSEIIQQEFKKIIWLSVNQNFNELDLLERTITEAGGDHSSIRNTKAALERTLKKTLIDSRTLLVMDDVWDHKAWDVLKSPLKNVLAQGSRVLVTTRHDMVARGMMAEEPYYRVDKLDQEDAWSLLKKQVVKNEGDESQVDLLLKDIGMEIVSRCDGLPLAIKAMGCFLRQKKICRSDWKNVLMDSIWSVSRMPEDINYAIHLSYQDLPSYLKPCFLHLSLLPESTLLGVDEIVGMWISEGFIDGGSRDLEELGREYYNELILRNLITETDIRYNYPQLCSMHNVVRSFAHYVSRDEALAAQNNNIGVSDKLKSQKIIRRISVETKRTESEQLDWTSLQTQIQLRTLILVGPIKNNPGDSLLMFSSLRTLHVQDTNFDDALAESLLQLQGLRYLSLERTNTSILPENIGNKMKLLQYIRVFHCPHLVKLPSSIGKLQHLRYLNIIGSRINNVPDGFSGLTNLRILYGFPAHIDGDRCTLEELGPLNKLTHLSIECLENISSSLLVKKVRLCEKMCLSLLMLNCTGKHESHNKLAEQQQIEEVFEELCPPPCLKNLSIRGYFGRQLPRWLMTPVVVSLGSLQFLKMEDLPYCTELPDRLCQLPCLEVLQIDNAPLIKSVGPELLQPHNQEHLSALENIGSAIELRVGQCNGLVRIGNLPRMKQLKIVGCPKLKVLEAMPVLQRLWLADYNMKTLPGYLQDINPKQLLTVDCDVSLLSSIAAGKSGPEWGKFCRIRQVKAYADDNDSNIRRKWYMVFTRDLFNLTTNISCFDTGPDLNECVQHPYSATCPVESEQAVGPTPMPAVQVEYNASGLNHLECVLTDERAEPTRLQLSLLQSITNNFSDDLQIGIGGFAAVYKGQLRNGTVAVKKLHEVLDVDEKKFLQEIDSLMKAKHDNIVRFLGYCYVVHGEVWKINGKNVMAEKRQRVLCFEFLPESLDNYISDASKRLDWISCYQIIKGICKGLHYLHKQNIVHLDLNPANILLDRNKVPKIADFGLSKCFEENQTRAMTSNVVGTLGYMAPEYINGGVVTFKSDIYSLGVILLEILTGQKVYPHPQIEHVLERWSTVFGTSQGDIRLEPVRISAEIGRECIDSDPGKRPDTQHIIERLDELEREYGSFCQELC